MKKPILLIAAALLLCGKVQAQDMAMSTTTQETEELAMDVSAASLLKSPTSPMARIIKSAWFPPTIP